MAQLPGDGAAGKTKYISSCAACHGFDAGGLQGLGSSLKESTLVHEQTAAELVEFLKDGRAADDPFNASGIEMPPRGGNSALNDQDLYDIAAFLRNTDSS